jgi:hypothetical protein
MHTDSLVVAGVLSSTCKHLLRLPWLHRVTPTPGAGRAPRCFVSKISLGLDKFMYADRGKVHRKEGGFDGPSQGTLG